MMELADPVAVSDRVVNSSVENVSGAGDTFCGFSSAVEAELLTGR
jgi:hypothetical protein